MKTIKTFNLSLGVLILLLIAASQTYAGGEVTPPCVSGSPTVVPGSRCGTGTVGLSITSAPTDFVARWFDSSGTTVLFTSSGSLSWTTPSISATTSYMVAWYRPEDGCTSGKVSITATVLTAPTTANAGPDQTSSATCGLTTVTLAGNTPSVGTGSWSITVNGGGSPSFGNQSSATSTFTGSAGATYTLSWTTTNGTCTSIDDVVITFNRTPTGANAGPDQTGASTCGLTSLTLAATAVTVGSGSWIVVSGSGGSFGNTASPTSSFTGTVDVSYTLRWTTVNSPCANSTDDVVVKINKAPTVSVSSASQTICSGQSASITVTNPNSMPGTTFAWTTSLVNADVFNTSTSSTISGNYSNIDGINDGTVTYQVFANSTLCSSAPTSATVTIRNVPEAPSPTPPLFYGVVPLQFTATEPKDAQTQWYTTSTITTPIDTGNVHINTSLGDALTYYVSFKNRSNTCESSRTRVDAISVGTVNPARIIEETVRVSGKLTDGDVNGISADSLKSVTVTYADGLSRAAQVISINASPGKKDIVMPVEYDSYGRNSKQYLPYTGSLTHVMDSVTGNSLPAFQSSYKANQFSFYLASGDKIANDSAAYSQTTYELSPLGRPLKSGKVGKKWQPGSTHESIIAYSFNKSSEGDDVRIFNTTFSVGSAVTSSSYSDNTLMRTTVTDENGHTEIVFANLAGQTLMRKKQLDGTINSVSVDYLRTAYVYDEMGRLNYIIPPGGYAALQANSWVLTQAILDGHLYQFVYDNRGRVTKKKTPGQDWIYFGYDKLNRLVLTQDGNIRSQNKWAFIKYDIRGRAVMAGLYTNATQTTLSAVQEILDAQYSSGVWYEITGTDLMGYTKQSFPTQNADASALDVMTVSYFNDYDFDKNGTVDYTFDSSPLSGVARTYTVGFPTGSTRKIIGTSTWLKTASFYDSFGRVIQTQGNNHLNTSGTDKTSISYDFEGKVITTKNYHNPGSNVVTVDLTPSYDGHGRVKYMQHNINGIGSKKVVNYQYNELSQLVMKQLHNVSGSTYMQNVDYRYSVNGWLTSINNAQLNSDGNVTNGDVNDYFGMELLYDTYDSGLGNNAVFNGLSSAVKWKSAGSAGGVTGQQSYNFSYDKTNKLLAATFKARGATSWNVDLDILNEAMTYDHNGNILSLQRNRKNPTGGASQLMDGLTYTYASGNFLSKVEDSALTDGFNNGVNTTTEYTYDGNGNLTADNNKGISGITYNSIGKPQQITFSSGSTIVYTYDATGAKLKMAVTVSGTTTTTDYVGGFVYNNGSLDFFSSPEGRVKKNGSSFEYEYFIKDHQDNTRVVFTSIAQKMTATFESGTQTSESLWFNSYPSGTGIDNVSSHNHTSGGSKSQLLNGSESSQVGVAKSYAVVPGDTVKISAYAMYDAASGGGTSNIANFAAALLAAFNLSAPAGGETGTGSSAINNWGSLAASGSGDGTDGVHPKAYVNILIFDKNYTLLDFAYSQVTSSGSPGLLSSSYVITQPGYAYLYVSNENSTVKDVYFDDVTISLSTQVIQSNDYYPFGLQAASSWTRGDTKNNFLYNEGSELNLTSVLYDLPYRNYDAALGRFFQVDLMAGSDHTMSPFVYAGNNPVNSNDPSGLMVDYANSISNPDYVFQMQIAAENRQQLYNLYAQWAEDSGGPMGGGGSGGGSGNMWSDAADVRWGRMSIEEYTQKYGGESLNLSNGGKLVGILYEDELGSGATGGPSAGGPSNSYAEADAQDQGGSNRQEFKFWGSIAGDEAEGGRQKVVTGHLSEYKMTVVTDYYKKTVEGQELWVAEIRAFSYHSAGNLLSVKPWMKAQLVVNDQSASKVIFLAVPNNAVYGDDNQNKFVGMASFVVPSSGSVEIRFQGSWLVNGNVTPTNVSPANMFSTIMINGGVTLRE
ncbi:MAG: DUF6443 domain-containing protein [Bacteroidota bacterium]